MQQNKRSSENDLSERTMKKRAIEVFELSSLNDDVLALVLKVLCARGEDKYRTVCKRWDRLVKENRNCVQSIAIYSVARTWNIKQFASFLDYPKILEVKWYCYYKDNPFGNGEFKIKIFINYTPLEELPKEKPSMFLFYNFPLTVKEHLYILRNRDVWRLEIGTRVFDSPKSQEKKEYLDDSKTLMCILSKIDTIVSRNDGIGSLNNIITTNTWPFATRGRYCKIYIHDNSVGVMSGASILHPDQYEQFKDRCEEIKFVFPFKDYFTSEMENLITSCLAVNTQCKKLSIRMPIATQNGVKSLWKHLPWILTSLKPTHALQELSLPYCVGLGSKSVMMGYIIDHGIKVLTLEYPTSFMYDAHNFQRFYDNNISFSDWVTNAKPLCDAAEKNAGQPPLLILKYRSETIGKNLERVVSVFEKEIHRKREAPTTCGTFEHLIKPMKAYI